MTGDRLAYPRLAGGLVSSINAVASCAGLRIPPNGEARISVCPAPNVSYKTCLTVGVTVGGSPARLHLDAGAVDAAVGSLIAVADFTALDAELQLAVLETALSTSLAHLGNALRGEVVLQNIRAEQADEDARDGPGDDSSADRRPSAGFLLLEVRGARGTVGCTMLLDVDAPLPDTVTKALGEGRRRWDCSDLPVRVTFEAGCASVAAREFRTLEPGDIVLFDHCYVTNDCLRVNICDSESRMGRLEGRRVTLAEDLPRDVHP